jgi:hypothetical protein
MVTLKKPKRAKGKSAKNGRTIEREAKLARVREPKPRSEEATRIPSHGHGRLITFQKGQPSANPSGRPASLRDVQQLCRKKSVSAVHALIACIETPDGKIVRNADPRAVALVSSTLLKWGYGEPPPYDPTQEKPELRIDLSGLTLDERRMLLAAMDRVTTVATENSHDTGPEFDPSRFEQEPPTIEAEPVTPSRSSYKAPVHAPRQRLHLS